MVRALFDVDVLLDVIEERQPQVEASSEALARVETGVAEGLVAADSLPTIFYLVQKHRGRDAAYAAVHLLLRLLDVVPVDRDRIAAALAMGWPDFEDALQTACAVHAGADVLVTRNVADYGKAVVTFETPERFLARGAADPRPSVDVDRDDERPEQEHGRDDAP